MFPCIHLTPLLAPQFRRNYAICPEYNAGESLHRCAIAAGQAVIVGLGQTVTCADGSTLTPRPFLQVVVDKSQVQCATSCTCCALNASSVASSSCAARPDEVAVVKRDTPTTLSTGGIVGVAVACGLIFLTVLALAIDVTCRGRRAVLYFLLGRLDVCTQTACACRRRSAAPPTPLVTGGPTFRLLNPILYLDGSVFVQSTELPTLASLRHPALGYTSADASWEQVCCSRAGVVWYTAVT